jgi:hypothetical protein
MVLETAKRYLTLAWFGQMVVPTITAAAIPMMISTNRVQARVKWERPSSRPRYERKSRGGNVIPLNVSSTL